MLFSSCIVGNAGCKADVHFYFQPANQVPEQDRQKYEKEFDEYYKELETAREK